MRCSTGSTAGCTTRLCTAISISRYSFCSCAFSSVFSFLLLADPLVWGWLVVATLQHHTFKHTVGLATEYAHPVEGVLNAIATMAGPVLLGGHMALCMLYAALKLWQSIDAHSGEPMQFIRHTSHK